MERRSQTKVPQKGPLLQSKLVTLDIPTCDVHHGVSVFRVFKGLTVLFFNDHDNGFRAGSLKALGSGTHPGKLLKETSDSQKWHLINTLTIPRRSRVHVLKSVFKVAFVSSTEKPRQALWFPGGH